MNIEDLSVKLGVDVTANVLLPAPSDLLVLKIDAFLNTNQRETLKANLIPTLEAIGCKVMVLERGMDLMVVKQAIADEAV